MKTIPARKRITFSTFVMALKYSPSFSMLKAITKANNITGKPVPKEKTTGKANPALVESVMGINMAKNKAPLYGQKAKANKAPNKKEPSRPLVLNFSESLSVSVPPSIKFSLITSNITSPMAMSTKPINFSPFP